MPINFAPLNVPLERRLQTLSACVWIITFAFGSVIAWSFVAYIIVFTNLWPLTLIYLLWAWYDQDTPYNGGRKWCFLKSFFLWKYFIQYFPIRLVKTADLPADRNYLFCVYPHGILSAGIFGNFGTNHSDCEVLFPDLNIHCATLNLHFKVPIFRDYLLALGAVSADKSSLETILHHKNRGNVCVLIVGGAAESLYAKPGSYRIILSRRRGFVRTALQTGCSLVPVFSFGEIDLYDQVTATPGSRLHRIQVWFKELTGMALCIPLGRGFFQYSFGIIPQRAPITTVVGKPIDLPKKLSPTEEEIDHYHNLFRTALIDLFNEHKDLYVSDPDKVVLIVE